MPTINDLTPEQFKNLLDDYFAPPEKRSKMKADEVKLLAERLNEKVNIPIIKETSEEKILIKIIIKIDSFLYDNLPNEIYDLVRSTEKGIDDEEAKRLISRLTKLANGKIDIPYIPEAAEYIAIKYVIGIVISSARKNWDFNKAKDSSDQELYALLP